MHRPQVVAHRGSSAVNAEHTLGAYRAALDDGADGFECDVRLTADGHLVCVHDRNLRRTASLDALVSNTTLAELQSLDFATWKDPLADLDEEFVEPDPALSRVLTLRELLEAAADYDRRIEVAIETKHPTRYAGLVERRLVETLDDFGWAGKDSPARVMSFSWVALRRVRRFAPALDLVYLMRNPGEWARARPFAEADWIAGPGMALVRAYPDLVRRITRTGTRAHVWVVNTEADADLCVSLGVEALITDKPDLLTAHFGRRSPSR